MTTEQKPETKTRRHRPRFTLRFLLLVVTAVGVGLGIWTHRARQQRRIVEAIEASGGGVCYELDGPAAPPPQYALKSWLSRNLGRDYVEGIVAASFRKREVMGEVVKLPRLESLQIFCDDVEDRDIALLARCPSIETLNIGVEEEGVLTKITDGSLAVLGKLPKLRVVHLRGAGISRAGIAAVATSPTIEVLDIGSCAPGVTARDFDEIKRRDKVKSLYAWRSVENSDKEEVIARW